MRIVCLSICLILICSCGGGKGTVVTNTTSQIRQDLTSGDFQKALDKCQVEYQKNPKEAGILEQFLGAIEHIKVFADKAFKRENFVLAGSTYALLLKNFPQFAPFAGKLSFDTNYLILKIRVSQTRVVERQDQIYLKTGSLQKAIDLYRELHQQYPRDLVVQDSCISFLELIKANADLAFKKNDLVLAGYTHRILLRNFGAFNFIGRSLPYDRELLNTNIKECQRKLFENGLKQYRSGNLSLAISIWKSVLTFDPENPEVKKAVDTAILQSRNLERNEVYDVK